MVTMMDITEHYEADLAEMESLSSKNKNVKYLYCVIDAFTKYL